MPLNHAMHTGIQATSSGLPQSPTLEQRKVAPSPCPAPCGAMCCQHLLRACRRQGRKPRAGTCWAQVPGGMCWHRCARVCSQPAHLAHLPGRREPSTSLVPAVPSEGVAKPLTANLPVSHHAPMAKAPGHACDAGCVATAPTHLCRHRRLLTAQRRPARPGGHKARSVSSSRPFRA